MLITSSKVKSFVAFFTNDSMFWQIFLNLFSDTFFNQSRYTFSWGSPDILPMFSKGASLNENQSTKVFTEMYDNSFEDFSANDLSQLDTWVFDIVEKFFDRASTDHDLQLKLRQDKIVLVRKNRRSENYFCTKNYYEI